MITLNLLKEVEYMLTNMRLNEFILLKITEKGGEIINEKKSKF